MLYGDVFYEYSGRHKPGCSLADKEILIEASDVEEIECPGCGAALHKDTYRDIMDVSKAERELDEVESELRETASRLEDREEEIENMNGIISEKEDAIRELQDEVSHLQSGLVE